MRLFVLAILASSATATAALGAETVKLTLQDHKFTPAQVQVPAGERFRVELVNRDDTTDELESTDMKFEKIVVAGGKIGVSAGPLRPGTYMFYDEYHKETAVGQITATGPAGK